MDNKVKIPCGGFYLGDGFTMDGNTLKSSGGSLIVTMADYTHTTHTATEIYEAFQSKKAVYFDYYGMVFHLSTATNRLATFHCIINQDTKIFNYTLIVNNTAEIDDVFSTVLYPATADTVILPSSTEGSNKRFKITVDDSGTISATETT